MTLPILIIGSGLGRPRRRIRVPTARLFGARLRAGMRPASRRRGDHVVEQRARRARSPGSRRADPQPGDDDRSPLEFRTSGDRLLFDLPVGRVGREFGVPSLALPRRAVMTALLEAIPEESLRFEQLFEGFEDCGGEVVARFSGGSAERGALLVGADGLRSRVRAQLHGPSAPRSSQQTAWVGIAPTQECNSQPGRMIAWIGRAQRFWAAAAESGLT